jgi:transposase
MIPLTYSKEQLAELRIELHRTTQKDGLHRYRVLLALVLIGERQQGMKEIAELIGVTVRTLINWLKQFMVDRMALFTKHWFKGRGRKSKLTKEEHKELYKLINEGPLANGFTCGGWNTAMINELIKRTFGVSYKERYLPRLLKKIGLSYQKAKFESDRLDDDDHRAKRQDWINNELPDIINKAKRDGSVVLFGDEVSFAMWGSLGRTWAPIGKQPVVKTTGTRKGLKIFGAIDLMEGGFHYRESLQYVLTQKSFTALKKKGMPVETVKQLKATINKEVFPTKQVFLSAIQVPMSKGIYDRYQSDMIQLAEVPGRFNGESYIEFLKQLIENNDRHVVLIEDGAPYHGRVIVKDFVKENSQQITIKRLPSFSPDYNPIEKLWKNTKRDATHLKYFETFEDLRDSVVSTFEFYINDASKVLGVMKKMREEFSITC